MQGYLRTLFSAPQKFGKNQALKAFSKIVGSEILEENLQEASQLAVSNILNQRANDLWKVDFSVDCSRENFLQTALLTTLTTGIMASKSGI